MAAVLRNSASAILGELKATSVGRILTPLHIPLIEWPHVSCYNDDLFLDLLVPLLLLFLSQSPKQRRSNNTDELYQRKRAACSVLADGADVLFFSFVAPSCDSRCFVHLLEHFLCSLLLQLDMP